MKTESERNFRAAAESLGRLQFSRARRYMETNLKQAQGDEASAKALSVRTLRTLADICRFQGNYSEAGAALKRALAICEEIQATSDPTGLERAQTLCSSGILCKYQGRFSQGRTHYREALKLALSVRPRETEFISVLYHNMAGLEWSAGKYRAAEGLARKCLSARKSLNPSLRSKMTPAMAADEVILASILAERGKIDEAKKIYRSALAIFSGRRKPHLYTYDTAIILNNLAAISDGEGCFEAAIIQYEKALRLLIAVQGRAHPDVGISLNNLGMVQWRSGHPKSALKSIRKAHLILQSALGARHPHVRACAANLQKVSRPDA